jgi:SNF2 family DNA or RNA helicase
MDVAVSKPFTIADYTWPAFQGRVPFSHQKATVKFLLSNKRALVLNDMGTGKTLAALWACDILMTAKKIRRVLIISPLSTMQSVWRNEIVLNMPHRRVGVAHGVKQVRLAVLQSQVEFVVINHDGIKILEDEIIAQQFDIIIIDELTAFKANSERTKCMKRIADMQSRSIKLKDKVKICNRQRHADGGLWGMTGDMAPNSPTEAFYQCEIVVPESQWLPKYFGQFRDACMFRVNDAVWVAKPEAPQIVAMVAQPAIRFTRDQCLDLPDTSHHVLDTDLTDEQIQYYDIMKRKALVDTDAGSITAANAAVQLNKLLQISAGAVKNDEGEVIEIGCKPRMDALEELFLQTPQRKLVIFATYRATIMMIVREMQARGYKIDCIHGDVPQAKRTLLIGSFQGGDLEMLVLQPQSSAHGITLTAASTILWFSLMPSGEIFQQGNARIVRAGQTRKTFIYMFVSTKAEKHIANILKNKGDLSKEILRLFVDHQL